MADTLLPVAAGFWSSGPSIAARIETALSAVQSTLDAHEKQHG